MVRTAFAILVLLFTSPLLAGDRDDLRLELVRESLTGTHYRYRQYLAGRPVTGGGVVVTVAANGERIEEKNLAVIAAGTRVRGNAVVNDRGVARFARRDVRSRHALEPVAEYRDPDSGVLLFERPLFFNARSGRVFEQNPVVTLNAPELRDESDSATAVPAGAYSLRELPGLAESGPLRGPWVTISDLEPVTNTPADASGELSFDRADDRFEEVNAYFHVDRAQRYLQSLGYRGVRSVAAYSIPVDPHGASGLDNSYYISAAQPGFGTLVFGDGGTDDAEDADLIVHEYAHAIQDWIAPGVFGGGYASESRAIGEALGDYWAFSSRYATAIASGRDPYCIADWDARCWTDPASEQCSYRPDSNCLRRVDGTKTMADFQAGNSPGTEHRNGEIISSTLREIFEVMVLRHGIEAGRRRADTIVVEALFGMAPDPEFSSLARRMLVANRLLFGGADDDAICAAFNARGIAVECPVRSLGASTWYQERPGLAIPDRDENGVTSSIVVDDPRAIASVVVSVNIRHPLRGDLRITLIAPDGTEVILAEPSADRDADLVTVFGRDAKPVQPLDVLAGRSAAGTWRLRVADTRSLDTGTLVDWSLGITFAGDVAPAQRPVAAVAETQYIAVAGSVVGANGERFVSRLTLANEGASARSVRLIFTPSVRDGRTQFAVATVQVDAGRTVVFEDVVATLFRTAGTGTIEVQGDVTASGAIVSTSAAGVFVQEVPAMRRADSSGTGRALAIPPMTLSATQRANVGFTDVAGIPAELSVAFFSNGELVSVVDVAVAPHSHVQLRVAPCASTCTLTAIVTVRQGGPVLGYASVIDASGAATYLPATPTSFFGSSESLEVPVPDQSRPELASLIRPSATLRGLRARR